MTLALVSTANQTILSVHAGSSTDVNVPGLWQAQNVGAGWQSTDGAYRLLPVTPFVPPPGFVVNGAPSYEIQGETVVETYAVVAAPIEIAAWKPITVIKALQSIQKSKADLFMNRMSDSDRARFSSASYVTENSALLISALAEPGVGITMQDLKTAIEALVGNGDG